MFNILPNLRAPLSLNFNTSLSNIEFWNRIRIYKVVKASAFSADTSFSYAPPESLIQTLWTILRVISLETNVAYKYHYSETIHIFAPVVLFWRNFKCLMNIRVRCRIDIFIFIQQIQNSKEFRVPFLKAEIFIFLFILDLCTNMPTYTNNNKLARFLVGTGGSNF